MLLRFCPVSEKLSMKSFIFLILRVCLMSLTTNIHATPIPKDFVYLKDIAPEIVQDIRYATANNFVGKPLPGYESAVCIVTKPTAQALKRVQQELNLQGVGLKIFDGYRPQMTVNEFIRWSKDRSCQKMKTHYYPNVDKADFFKLGYVAEKSGHTRGSTVDLTLIDLQSKQELDMGTDFDFMDELSHPFNRKVSEKQFQNRQLLNQMMTKHGFISLTEHDPEWWHFTLKNELYPDTYFNFPIQNSGY